MRTDIYSTPEGTLEITIIGHSSVTLSWQGKTIQVDPYSEEGDYTQLPKADLILITHHHSDHLDPDAIAGTTKPGTEIIGTRIVAEQLHQPITILQNGGKTSWQGIGIEAVPAYNIIQMRSPGMPFHIKGEGNGYMLQFGPLRVYIAGDTEIIPEMESFGDIDIAFLPKDLPYTMSDSMFIETARLLKPRVLYPYHYFHIDCPALQKALSMITVNC